MKKILTPSLLAFAAAVATPLYADTADAELLAEIKAMKTRLDQLETRVGELQQENNSLRIAQQAPSHHSDSPKTDIVSGHHPLADAAPATELVESVELSGTVEFGAYAGEGYVDDDYSDLTVDTAAVALNAELGDYSSAEISLLYEENATELEVDTASMTFTKEGNPFALQLGQTYLPFGSYSTGLVNDTLAHDIGEIRETAAIAGFSQDGLTAQTYVFNGDVDHDGDNNNTLQNWGARLAWDSDSGGIGLDYISNVADSDSIDDFVHDDEQWDAAIIDPDQWLRNEIGAYSLHGYVNLGPLTLTAEALHTDGFSSAEMTKAQLAQAALVDARLVGEKPSAWQLEVDYHVALFGREYTISTAWQETEDALFLELPKRRQSVGASTALDEKTTLGLELWRDKDYRVSEGGTGEASSNIGLLLTREF